MGARRYSRILLSLWLGAMVPWMTEEQRRPPKLQCSRRWFSESQSSWPNCARWSMLQCCRWSRRCLTMGFTLTLFQALLSDTYLEDIQLYITYPNLLRRIRPSMSCTPPHPRRRRVRPMRRRRLRSLLGTSPFWHMALQMLRCTFPRPCRTELCMPCRWSGSSSFPSIAALVRKRRCSWFVLSGARAATLSASRRARSACTSRSCDAHCSPTRGIVRPARPFAGGGGP